MRFEKYVCMLSYVLSMSVWDPVKIGWVRPENHKAEWNKVVVALSNANSKAINAIFYGVSTDEFHRISNVHTTQEPWKILETTYEGTTDSHYSI